MCMCIRSYTVLTVQCVVHWLVYCRQVYFILEAIGILSILSYNGCPAFITYTQNVIYGVLQSVMQAINFGEILVWVVVLLSSRCTCRQGSLFKGWGMVTLYVAQCVADHQHWWKLVRQCLLRVRVVVLRIVRVRKSNVLPTLRLPLSIITS